MTKPDAPDEAQTNAAGQAPCYSEVKPSQANHLPVTSATSVPATPADTGEDQGRDEATPRVPTQPAPAAPNAPTPRTDAFAASAKRDWNTSKFPVWTHESAVVNAILGEAIDTMKNLERELAAANAARKELK